MVHLTKIIILLLTAAIVLSMVPIAAAEKSSADGFDQSLRKGEARETLDPEMFKNPLIKKAYRAAKEIPWVLDSIYCYCYCKESPTFKHKSLLSCYVDLHAARWDICLREALRAFELYEQGNSVEEIKKIVEKEFQR